METNSNPPAVFCYYAYVKVVAVLAGWLYICWFQSLRFQGTLTLNKFRYFFPALSVLISTMPSLKLDKELHIKGTSMLYGKIPLQMGKMRVNRRNTESKEQSKYTVGDRRELFEEVLKD